MVLKNVNFSILYSNKYENKLNAASYLASFDHDFKNYVIRKSLKYEYLTKCLCYNFCYSLNM